MTEASDIITGPAGRTDGSTADPKTDSPSRVVVVGQGYVGLPLAVRAVEAGRHVIGYDSDKRKVSALAAGESYIDDVDGPTLQAALATGRYHPTHVDDDLVGYDVAVITVPTPLTDGAPDISYIEAATNTLGRYLTPGALIVLESTTYPGTTEEVVAPLLESASGLTAGRDFRLGYSPERIDPGNETWDFRRTPKVVSGMDDASTTAVERFYGDLVDTVVVVGGTREAELTKLLENTFRHVNIAMVNELAIHARSLGIDIWEVIDAADTKPFGFMRFTPGPGVGGHCLPIDPSYLSWRIERQLGTVSRFVKVANDVNNGMPGYVAGRIQSGLNDRVKPVKGSSVLVLGVAYKKNSSDARETPATELIHHLLAMGAEVSVFDTKVDAYELDDSVTRVPALEDKLLTEADAVVLVTDHDDVDYDRVVELAPYVFDTRHRLAQEPSVEHL